MSKPSRNRIRRLSLLGKYLYSRTPLLSLGTSLTSRIPAACSALLGLPGLDRVDVAGADGFVATVVTAVAGP